MDQVSRVQIVPNSEEREWLTHALKKVIARRRGDLLDAAPLVEPTNDWFPELWSATAAHGHRLTQRMMFYAGLSELKLSLSAYEPVWDEGDEVPWDANTAGWFAGVRDGRAIFGLNVDQFGDPEAAAGVMAHEVAHAWRQHHHLTVDDREKEELLTDVSTIALGFGILSTNNTDRYRTWGNSQLSGWSNSAVGYLPPYAMAWLLALWCQARNVPGERRAIEKHLEPNQRASFRAALAEIAETGVSPRKLLGGGNWPARPDRVNPEAFTPREPSREEISEPEHEEPDQVNRGRQVYRTPKGDRATHVFLGATPAFLAGWFVVLFAAGDRALSAGIMTGAVSAAIAAAIMLVRSNADVCSACRTLANPDAALCVGCGGTLGRRVSHGELRRLREEELERLASAEETYEDCSHCAPEEPCERHGRAVAASGTVAAE